MTLEVCSTENSRGHNRKFAFQIDGSWGTLGANFVSPAEKFVFAQHQNQFRLMTLPESSRAPSPRPQIISDLEEDNI